MKTAIPTDDGKTVGKVFGRAKSFAIHDSEDGSLTVVSNEGAGAEHGAGTGAASFLAERGVRAVAAPEVGPKAAAALAAAGIRIRTVPAGTDLNTASGPS
jgi:predicted Fe-Mo cluster-binding NifX family protein